MEITMDSTRRGSEDGFCTRLFLKGESYLVSDSLGSLFIRRGFAEPTEPVKSMGEVTDELISHLARLRNPATNPATYAARGEAL